MRTSASKQILPHEPATSSHVRTAAPAVPVPTNPFLFLQHTVGNQAVQRMLKAEGKSGGQAEKTIDGGAAPEPVDAPPVEGSVGGPPAVPMDTKPAVPPVGPAWKAGAHVAPNFIVSETEGARSNEDPATTDVDTPTFTGGAAVDAAGSMWRYQIQSVEGKGRINLVFYTKDHYPAPTPNDDTGALSNVKKDNWEDIVKDLDTHKTIVAGDWSAYKRTILHERYHWEKEWQGSVKPEVVNAENDIEKEGVSFAAAADAAAAEKALAPKATTIFNKAMAAARKAYNALGDKAGDPPFVAGSKGVTPLIDRIKAYAKAQKW